MGNRCLRSDLGETEMNEAVRALGAKEASDLIGDHIDAFLDGGPDLEAEDVELGQAVGLKVERISGRWNDARDYLLHTPPAPRVGKAAEEPVTMTALPAQEAEKVKEASDSGSATTWKRRSWGGEEIGPSASSEELVTKVLGKKKSEADLFISPATLPRVESPKRERVEVARWTPPPKGVSDLEALTYVPGLTGQIVEWIVRGAKRPNRMMALGVASVVIGTLIGRVVEGPTGSATHLFLIILAPSGYGKNSPLQYGAKLMDAVGRGNLLGPQEFASAPGFTKRLKRNPLMVCFVDELGDELNLINNQGANQWVSKMIGTFKKCYNAWTTVITAEKVSEESEKILWPAPSIVGAATPESFFTALQPKDLESGFANRLVILPFEGHRRPSEQNVPLGADEPPKALVTALKKLCRQPSLGNRLLDGDFNALPSGTPPIREPVPWGEGAAEVYYAFSTKMDAFENSDRQRYELGMRACENAVRWATNIAVGRFSPTVDREDISWAVKLSERSFNAAVGGVDRYMQEYLEFPKFCARILDALHANGGEMTKRDVLRLLGRKQRYGIELERALLPLKKEERINFVERSPATGGPTSIVIVLVGERGP